MNLKTTINLSLDRITLILDLLDNPHNDLNIIHVAGTNGKGSTIAFMAAVLIASDYKTGQFNSPYFLDPSDSILINGKPSFLYQQIYDQVSELSMARNLGCTPFEIETAAALQIFKLEQVDIVLLEVGMGGRLDATNVINPPKLAIITSISMDHTEYLGNNVTDIAKEKCGIIKKGTHSIIVSDQEFDQVYSVIQSFSQAANSTVHRVDSNLITSSKDKNRVTVDYFSESLVLPLKLQGNHQINNACTALLALSKLQIIDAHFRFNPQSIKKGMENVYWPGRLEKFQFQNHEILIDGAHNVAGAKRLREFVKDYQNITWILAFSRNKDVKGILDVLLQDGDTVILLGFGSPYNMPWVKCMDPTEISSIISSYSLQIDVSIADDFHNALKKIKRQSKIVVCGSLYMISQVYRTLQ